MLGTPVDRTEIDSESEINARWALTSDRNPRNLDVSDRSNGLNSKPSGRGKRGGRPRSSNPRRVPRGRAQRDSGDEDGSSHDEGDTSNRNLRETPSHKRRSSQCSADPNQSASSQSETSENGEEDEEEHDDDDDNEDPDEDDENYENDQVREPTQDHDTSISKHDRGRKPKLVQQKEPQSKSNQKKEPYIRKVELPREKLSAADLEAKMTAMALKNAQLIEQRKAADQDAAEYREIELQSQQAFEAQRDQQKAIDAVRGIAAERKLKKAQGREWDFEKSEEDWNRSRPYIDSMTHPNPGKNSWYTSRGPGYRGRPARGSHHPRRGTGRGGKRGGRGISSGYGQKNEYPQAESPDRSQAAAMENKSTTDQDPVPSEWY